MINAAPVITNEPIRPCVRKRVGCGPGGCKTLRFVIRRWVAYSVNHANRGDCRVKRTTQNSQPLLPVGGRDSLNQRRFLLPKIKPLEASWLHSSKKLVELTCEDGFYLFWEDGWSIARFWRVFKYKVRMWYLSHNPICYAALPMHCWMFPMFFRCLYVFHLLKIKLCNIQFDSQILHCFVLLRRASMPYGAWRDDKADVKPQRIPR